MGPVLEDRLFISEHFREEVEEVVWAHAFLGLESQGGLPQLLPDQPAPEKFPHLLEIVVEGSPGLEDGEGSLCPADKEGVADFLVDDDREEVHGEGEQFGGKVDVESLGVKVKDTGVQVAVNFFELGEVDGSLLNQQMVTH